jgi:hypothetical protein
MHATKVMYYHGQSASTREKREKNISHSPNIGHPKSKAMIVSFPYKKANVSYSSE